MPYIGFRMLLQPHAEVDGADIPSNWTALLLLLLWLLPRSVGGISMIIPSNGMGSIHRSEGLLLCRCYSNRLGRG